MYHLSEYTVSYLSITVISTCRIPNLVRNHHGSSLTSNGIARFFHGRTSTKESQNSSTLRRLASDHASLHKSDLPPHYLFPPSNLSSSIPDDLTQLTILLTGPQGTPYSQGLWKLHLKIPHDYPKSPPKAAFRTKIWHPNVEESTGSVCVDTLKRDWEPKLTLRDVLIVGLHQPNFVLLMSILTTASLQTISCLLIQPNPDSALNAAAGQLLQEDYHTFSRQARLMTSIHATVPANLREAVAQAQCRGEEASKKTKGDRKWNSKSVGLLGLSADKGQDSAIQQSAANEAESDDDENEATASKENDPSLSPSPVAPQSPRKNILGKRPLADLPTPLDTDDDEEDNCSSMTSSDRNVAKNTQHLSNAQTCTEGNGERQRKSPKLAERSRSFNFASRGKDTSEVATGLMITPFEDAGGEITATKRVCSGEGKENVTETTGEKKEQVVVPKPALPVNAGPKVSAGRNISATSSASGNGKAARPRVGLRRL